MENIEHTLRDTHQQLQQAINVDRHLKLVNQKLEEAYKNLDVLENQLKKEFEDIQQLEKLSLKGLFHQVLGSKEDQMEKERQEYLQASLKYDEAKKSSELLEFERDLLQRKVENIPQLKAKLKSLLEQRQKFLVRENSTIGNQIVKLMEMVDRQGELIHRITDLKKTAQQAIAILEQMINALQKARNWGQWDMAGRQRGASYLKHSAIDKARDLSYHAQHILTRLSHDMETLYGQRLPNFHVQIESFNRFTDVFFDNLISDWIVQRKIQNALNNVISVRDGVLRTLQSMDHEIRKCQDKIDELHKHREKLIIES